ncbi:sulfate ABC transporter ATP-binding protein [Lactococcus hodotermopsidis]|uniref:Sulfate ABC transporter ATP-binding protein n=1 Tax=Pseudolactococcus hodotermopsidis TaxID=2709157 RepID=A0A6A0BBF9_9LACT|nr:ABC transporter ATP-binding protein/permease [Lactococcus hodotermopsidis]GFH41995.1 sulfate ABC transporter ATP-binding protein [Lactococcus hodotermopsidis]
MLQLRRISKRYMTNEFTQIALDEVSVNFRENEFVAILGPSGSGKTTLLNIIGGLDHYDTGDMLIDPKHISYPVSRYLAGYDAGDLLINGKSTRDFKDRDWDAYRNNSVGFIFQSYNLIGHLSVLENVEMGMTLSGVAKATKKSEAIKALERVGLKDHVHKKPNQLSGGQMQRVAIARALANDPDIILADEPTGALDTVTSEQIMALIKDIAKDKLVIMVTHNPDLATTYADRIINFKDGHLLSDSHPFDGEKETSDYVLKKTAMGLFTALKLSARNIWTKKWRTALTAFASSIGIVGIALILSTSNGFQKHINQFQTDSLTEFPIIISPQATRNKNELTPSEREKLEKKSLSKSKEIEVYDPAKLVSVHRNKLTPKYIDYVEKISTKDATSVGFTHIISLNLLRDDKGKIVPVKLPTGEEMPANIAIYDTDVHLTTYPVQPDGEKESYLEINYDILAGSYPKNANEVVMVVDDQNRVDMTTMKNLGFTDFADKEGQIKFSDIVGMEMKLIRNNDYYTEVSTGHFAPTQDLAAVYKKSSGETIKIAGIIRKKKTIQFRLLGLGIAYSDELFEKILKAEGDSKIVTAQKNANTNVLTKEPLTPETKITALSYLGGNAIPLMIYVYPKSFESKENIIKYLDKYNKNKKEEDKVIYTDLGKEMTRLTGDIMSGITLVLVAFAAISLVVSLIMVGIITYISVLERTKEIGALRALGARKKDITRVFNAETLIIGSFSGILGITFAYLLTFPVNMIIKKKTDLSNVAQLNPLHAIILIIVSVTLTLLGGSIPAKYAAKKNPVEALRSE